MKKLFALLLCLVLMVPALALAETEITLWTYPIGRWSKSDVVDEIVANFNAVYPDIKVKVEYLDYTSGDDQVTAAIEAGTTPDEARAWWVAYLSQQANARGVELSALEITPVQVARVVDLIKEGKLTNKLARKAVDGVLEGEGDVDEVVKARGLEVVRDDGAIEAAVDEALAANPDIVEKYKAGNKKVVGAIVGQVMKATRGKADPAQVNQLIAKKLG